MDEQGVRTNAYTIELADDFLLGQWGTVVKGSDIVPYPGVPGDQFFDDTLNGDDSLFDPPFTFADPVRAPQLFRVEVYSTTAIELFWERVEGLSGTVLYDVYRDFELVYSGDGTSVFLNDMVAQQYYFFEVFAYEELGSNYSDFAIIDVVISEDGTRNDDDFFNFFDDPFIGEQDGPPENAYGAVYSRSAVEVFWQKPSGWEPKYYEVFRDAEFLGFTEGTSWFDEGLLADTTYIYEIYAAEPFSGTFSIVPAAVFLTTND